jgi:hypothetical protein
MLIAALVGTLASGAHVPAQKSVPREDPEPKSEPMIPNRAERRRRQRAARKAGEGQS